MRKFVLSLLLLLCLAIPSQATNFIEVARDDNFLIYLDNDSIEDRGEYVVAWSKCIPRGEAKKRFDKEANANVSSILYFHAFNKKYKQEQTLSAIAYDSTGRNVLNENRKFSDSQYNEIAPTSHLNHLYGIVSLVNDVKQHNITLEELKVEWEKVFGEKFMANHPSLDETLESSQTERPTFDELYDSAEGTPSTEPKQYMSLDEAIKKEFGDEQGGQRPTIDEIMKRHGFAMPDLGQEEPRQVTIDDIYEDARKQTSTAQNQAIKYFLVDLLLCAPALILRFRTIKRRFNFLTALSYAVVMYIICVALFSYPALIAMRAYPGYSPILSYFLLRAKDKSKDNSSLIGSPSDGTFRQL